MTQKQMVLMHLQKGNALTSMGAITQFGATRLADIVFKLKQTGHPIKDEWCQVGKKRFKKYYLGREV